MMIAILLESKRCGKTSWAAVRGRTRLRIIGLSEGDDLRIDFRHSSGEEKSEHFVNNGEFAIAPGVSAIRAEHIETSGNRVTVDLV